MKLTNIIEENYEKIDPKKIDELILSKNGITEKLLTLFSEESRKNHTLLDLNKINNLLGVLIRPLIQDITPEEITRISTCISAFQETKESKITGFFLTKLINEHHEYAKKNIEYTLITSNFNTDVTGIGYQNRARIRVCGNGGNLLGHIMEEGSIHVEGNCIQSVGLYMHGGKISITGNVKSVVGAGMNNGEIHIFGNVEKNVGEQMRNGTITIQGNVTDLLAQKLECGTITVYGNAGKNIGKDMYGGTVELQGTYEHISENYIAGQIFHQGKRIRTTSKERIEKAKEIMKRLNL